MIYQADTSYRHALSDLQLGNVDMLIGDIARVAFAAKRLGVQGLKAGEFSNFNFYAHFVGLKDERIMMSILSKAILDIDQKEANALAEDWDIPGNAASFPYRKNSIILASLIGLAFLLLIAYIVFLHYRIKKQTGLLKKQILSHKNALKELEESERRSRSFMDNSSFGMFRFDLHGTMLEGNMALAKLVHFTSPGDLLSDSSYGRAVFTQIIDRVHGIERLFNSTTAHRIELEIRKKGGEVLLGLASVWGSKDSNQEPKYIEGVLEDITARRTLEDALRDSESRYRNLIYHASDGILLFQVSGEVQDANPSACRNLGYSRDELVRKHARDLIVSETVDTDVARWSGFRPGLHFKTEVVAKRSTGSVFPAEIRLSVFVSRSRRFVLITGTNFSRRKELEQAMTEAYDAARAASRQKSAFLANMSHEIRTPMNAIVGFSDILAEHVDGDESKRILMVIQRNANNLLRILNDILDISKVEANKIEIEDSPFSLPSLLGDLIETYTGRLEKKPVRFRSDISKAPAQVIGDQVRVRQILSNLLDNAVKFTNKGQITLSVDSSTHEDENQVRIRFSVCDTGVGIPLNKQSSVFNPFEQADISTTRQYGGTGLGLALCRHLIELMGGKIWIKSSPGKGATFSFDLLFKSASRYDTKPI